MPNPTEPERTADGPEEEPITEREFDRIASVTIQGGAVYGLSLLGQLQGVLDEGYEIVALAGTSAGAIVATLYWAGLKTSDIRQFFEQRARTRDGVTTLLDGTGPAAPKFTAAHLTRLKASAGRFAAWASELVTRPLWSRYVHRMLLPFYPFTHIVPILRTMRNGWLGFRSSLPGGLFPGEVFEQEIDRLIRRSPQVAPHIASGRLPANGLLTFGQLRGLLDDAVAYFPALTLTATNLSTGRLELIDSTDRRYDGVPIAKAVRASGGFPLFFRPVEIELPDPDESGTRRVHSLVDGGVICNFPAYVFASRTRRDQFGEVPIYQPYVMRPWVNIGLRLTESPPTNLGPVRTRAGVVGRVWNFLSVGTRTHLETALAESTVERLVSLGQPFTETGWPHGLLDFDRLTPELVRRMYDRGREFARAHLADLRFSRPPVDEIQPLMDDLIDAACRVLGHPDNTGLQFRATLFTPDDLDLVLDYRSNMDQPADTDRYLRLEYWQGLVGFCFVRRRPLLCNLRLLEQSIREGVADPERLFGLTPEIRDRIRKDRTWLMSVPVFDPETATPDPYGDNPEVGVEGLHYDELDSPLDGALFGILSLDALLDYGTLKLSEDVAKQAEDPRVLALRDIMVAAAWRLGKVFAAYFAATLPGGDEGG